MSKVPKIKESPSPIKRPAAQPLADFNRTNPAWRVGRIDLTRPDDWKRVHQLDEPTLRRIQACLGQCEGKTWTDILVKSGYANHSIKVERLSAGAQKRLGQLQIDVETLVSLRVTAKERVWGVRDGNVLTLLWWDPNHRVYPVEKKYT